MNSATINIGAHKYECVFDRITVFALDMDLCGIAGLYGSSIFNFLRTLNTVFHVAVLFYIPTNCA